jgi:hypothetical protein
MRESFFTKLSRGGERAAGSTRNTGTTDRVNRKDSLPFIATRLGFARGTGGWARTIRHVSCFRRAYKIGHTRKSRLTRLLAQKLLKKGPTAKFIIINTLWSIGTMLKKRESRWAINVVAHRANDAMVHRSIAWHARRDDLPIRRRGQLDEEFLMMNQQGGVDPNPAGSPKLVLISPKGPERQL